MRLGGLMIVGGLVLLLAGSSWFVGATTVGWILLLLGIPLFLISLTLLLIALAAVAAQGSSAAVATTKRDRRGF